MEFEQGFEIRPLPEAGIPIHPIPANPLGPIADLLGKWKGVGFNTIWRPFNPKTTSDRFLELNLTSETLEFVRIPGTIKNRGLLQPDVDMFGLTYLQQISDSNLHAGIHVEPGIWAKVPTTTDPAEGETVVRMASIPHGTTVLAQGQAFTISGPPTINLTNINPFPIGGSGGTTPFPEQNLAVPTTFRSPPAQLVGITQAMVDNPNSVLKAAIASQHITKTIALVISTNPTAPIVGGGTENTSFLQGTSDGPNAQAASMTAIFWIESVAATAHEPAFTQLQYTQTVLLNFNGLSWPHVSVATLRHHKH